MHIPETSVRNLLNSTESCTCVTGTRTAKIASVHDLRMLKQVHPYACIRHGDISPLICQNCDAAGRVLSQTLVQQLALHVPGSEASQLYLQASVWIHVPYRDNMFGSPKKMTTSLSAGLMTFGNT